MPGSDGFGRQGSNPVWYWPDNGTTYVFAGLGDSLRFGVNSGWVFDLVSVDLAEWNTVYPDPVTVRFTGYRKDGTTVTTNFTTDGVIDGIGPGADFETFYFGPEFSGLTSVDVPGHGWSLDNLVISDLCKSVRLTTFDIQPRPDNIYVPAGTNLTLAVSADGTPPLGYQWQFNGTDLPGATANVLIITNAQPTDSGSYFVRVTNACSAYTSAVTFSIVGRPLVSMTMLSATRYMGGGVTNSVWVMGGVPLTYQWRRDGTNIAGATTGSVLVLTNLQLSSSGNYSLAVSNAWGSTVSSNFQLAVLEPLVLVQHPVSQRAWVGGTATFEVAASGAPPLYYLWRKDGQSLWPETNRQLTLSGLTRRDSGLYRCRVFSGTTMQEAFSSNASLVVLAPQRLEPLGGGPDCLLTVSSRDADGGLLLPADLARFELQASTNLLDWLALPNRLLLTNGLLEFTETNSPGNAQRFYRVLERVP